MFLFFFKHFYIPSNVSIKGDVDLEESCILDGKIEGTLRSQKQVYIKKGGILTGNLFAKKVKIAGTVTGDVHAIKLSVLPGGLVKGKLLSKRISIHEKAMVEDVETVLTSHNTEATDLTQTWF